MRKYAGLIVGVVLLLSAGVLGWMFEHSILPAQLGDASRGVIRSDSELRFVTQTLTILVVYLPSLVALVMLWIAFVRVDVRDRYLWSAVTIISSGNAGIVEWLIPDLHGHWPTVRGPYYINPFIASAMVAYAAWFLAITKDSRRQSLGIVPLAAFLMVLVLPIPDAYASWATMICTVCEAWGAWAIAVWFAMSVGYDVYASEIEELPDAC